MHLTICLTKDTDGPIRARKVSRNQQRTTYDVPIYAALMYPLAIVIMLRNRIIFCSGFDDYVLALAVTTTDSALQYYDNAQC